MSAPARALIDFATQATRSELETAFGEARAKHLITEETLTAQEDDGFDEPVSLSERLAGAPMEHIEHGPSAVAEPARRLACGASPARQPIDSRLSFR